MSSLFFKMRSGVKDFVFITVIHLLKNVHAHYQNYIRYNYNVFSRCSRKKNHSTFLKSLMLIIFM